MSLRKRFKIWRLKRKIGFHESCVRSFLREAGKNMSAARCWEESIPRYQAELAALETQLKGSHLHDD